MPPTTTAPFSPTPEHPYAVRLEVFGGDAESMARGLSEVHGAADWSAGHQGVIMEDGLATVTWLRATLDDARALARELMTLAHVLRWHPDVYSVLVHDGAGWREWGAIRSGPVSPTPADGPKRRTFRRVPACLHALDPVRESVRLAAELVRKQIEDDMESSDHELLSTYAAVCRAEGGLNVEVARDAVKRHREVAGWAAVARTLPELVPMLSALFRDPGPPVGVAYVPPPQPELETTERPDHEIVGTVQWPLYAQILDLAFDADLTVDTTGRIIGCLTPLRLFEEAADVGYRDFPEWVQHLAGAVCVAPRGGEGFGESRGTMWLRTFYVKVIEPTVGVRGPVVTPPPPAETPPIYAPAAPQAGGGLPADLPTDGHLVPQE